MGLSTKGCIDSELFRGWMIDHFLKYAVSARPLLLLLDGHSSHYDPATLQFAREHDVIVLCLPPHTMHEAQPLDCCVFGPLKRMWTYACHEFTQNNPGWIITKFQFSSLFFTAWNNAVTPAK